MRILFITLFLSLISFSAMARDPIFIPPIDCTFGVDCYVQNYVDTDPGDGAADFTCGTLSYDGHKGTDFALPSIVAMWQGVDVLASAPGTIQAIRTGMEDFPQGTEGAPDVSGKECGNGIVINHGGGWTTQYCHMMNGSLTVEKGRKVTKGTVLGKVGLSGRTEFPHVHLSIRKNGEVIDPYNPDGIITCGEKDIPNGTLWQDPMTYEPGGILSIGVTDHVPEYSAVKGGTAGKLDIPADSPSLVSFALVYGAKTNDIIRISISGPSGEVVSHDAEIGKSQALLFRAAGKKARAAWPKGGYRTMVQMIRNDSVIDQMSQDFIVP